VIFLLASNASALELSAREVKAAFLFRFGFYVEWPAAAFGTRTSPINLCIIGNDPFGALLDDNVKGQRIGDRSVEVRRLSSVSGSSGCHIAFLSRDDARSGEALSALQGRSVLTVTEGERGGSVGIINFVVQNNRVRFDIDDDAAASDGLVISSRLLNLALQVKPRH
jgi:hypothetical protein